jgi:hypothetical protein
MTAEQIRHAIEEGLRRVGEHAETRIGIVRELWSGRWVADVLDTASGSQRTTISFDAPDGISLDQVIERAGVELQEWLKLCGLCRRRSYVTWDGGQHRVLFFACDHCGSYLIDANEVTDLRRLVAGGHSEALRAVPRLIQFVQDRQRQSEFPFIENWRADVRE